MTSVVGVVETRVVLVVVEIVLVEVVSEEEVVPNEVFVVCVISLVTVKRIGLVVVFVVTNVSVVVLAIGKAGEPIAAPIISVTTASPTAVGTVSRLLIPSSFYICKSQLFHPIQFFNCSPNQNT